MIRIYLFMSCFEGVICKQIKINDDVHASVQDLEADSVGANPPTTILPPLAFHQNYLFESEIDCVETTNHDFKFTICPMFNATQSSLNGLGTETRVLGHRL